MADRMIRFAILMSLSFGGVSAVRAELIDPTRPPAGIGIPVSAGMPTDSQPTGLQSVIISKTHRAAIIGGKLVELGGKYGDARLVEINEGSVVLRGSEGRQVLSLFPEVKMSGNKKLESIKPQAAIKSGSSGSKAAPTTHKEEK